MDLTPEKMKMLRKEKKLSQAEVADFIGVSHRIAVFPSWLKAIRFVN